jgi:hypothetical protein
VRFVSPHGGAMAISISPSFRDSKLDSPSTDDVIDVYEDRVRNWLLAPAKVLLEQEHGGPAAFCILLTYFEGACSYARCQSSKNRSKEFFSRGFVDVFKSSNVPETLLLRVGDLLYSDARCGFFHDGMFRERVYFAEMNRDIVITLPKKGTKLRTSACRGSSKRCGFRRPLKARVERQLSSKLNGGSGSGAVACAASKLT